MWTKEIDLEMSEVIKVIGAWGPGHFIGILAILFVVNAPVLYFFWLTLQSFLAEIQKVTTALVKSAEAEIEMAGAVREISSQLRTRPCLWKGDEWERQDRLDRAEKELYMPIRTDGEGNQISPSSGYRIQREGREDREGSRDVRDAREGNRRRE